MGASRTLCIRTIAVSFISTLIFVSTLVVAPIAMAQQTNPECGSKLDEAKAKAADDNRALEDANRAAMQAEAERAGNPSSETSQNVLTAQEIQKLAKLSVDSSMKMLDRAQRKCTESGGTAKSEPHKPVAPSAPEKPAAPTPAKPVVEAVAAPAPAPVKPVVEVAAPPAPAPAKPAVEVAAPPAPAPVKPVVEVAAPPAPAKPVVEVAPPVVAAKPAVKVAAVPVPKKEKESEEPVDANCMALPDHPAQAVTEPTPLDQQLMAYAQAEMRRVDKLLASPVPGDKPTYDETPVLAGSKLKPCTKAEKDALVFKYLGQGQYRAETPLLAGEQTFTVGAHATLKRVVPEEESGQIFVFILDASKNPNEARLVAFKKWYLDK